MVSTGVWSYSVPHGKARLSEVCLNPEPVPPSLLTQLRQATRDGHRRLERHPWLAALLERDLSREHYGRLVAAFAGFYQPLEQALAPVLGLLPAGGYDFMPRTPLLLQDLQDLGAGAPLPCRQPPSQPTGWEALLGTLYVLEGASQGGRVIAPRLARLGLDGDHGGRFFHLCRRRPRDWPAFCELLQHQGHGARPGPVLSQACEVFDGLYRHLLDLAPLSHHQEPR